MAELRRTHRNATSNGLDILRDRPSACDPKNYGAAARLRVVVIIKIAGLAL
jgi:hypothetical protein